jgi:hypothetical protein
MIQSDGLYTRRNKYVEAANRIDSVSQPNYSGATVNKVFAGGTLALDNALI